jgi:hypothetical protein
LLRGQAGTEGRPTTVRHENVNPKYCTLIVAAGAAERQICFFYPPLDLTPLRRCAPQRADRRTSQSFLDAQRRFTFRHLLPDDGIRANLQRG